MKILYLLKKEPSKSLRRIIEIQSKGNEVEMIDLTGDLDYRKLVEDIFTFDKVFCL